MTPTDKAAAHAKKNDHRKHENKNRSGMFWTEQEEADLKEYFKHSWTISGIANLHARSELAIECRLIKLELIDENLKPIIQGATGMENTLIKSDKWTATQIVNSNGTKEYPYLSNHFLKAPGFKTDWYDCPDGLQKMKNLAWANRFWFINGDGQLYGPEEKKKAFKTMEETEYRATFAKSSCGANGSLNYPYKLGNMLGRMSGYTLEMYNTENLHATIQCAEKAGVYFIDGYGQIHGSNKKQKGTIDYMIIDKYSKLEHSLTEAQAEPITYASWTAKEKAKFSDVKPTPRIKQMPTGSRKYLLL